MIGGVRPGAGRPPALAKQVADAQKIANKLSTQLKVALGRLGDEYPNMLDTAIELAQERDADGKYIGDKRILLELIKLPINFVRVSDDERQSPFGDLLDQIHKELRTVNVQINVGRQEPLANNKQSDIVEAEYTVVPGAESPSSV